MIKKILLIEPPVTRPMDFDAKKVRIGIVPPLGLAYIAAVLEEHGYEVKILDCLIEGSLKGKKYRDKIRYGLLDKEIEEIIRKFNPDIVGVSCLISAKVYDMLNVCKIVKDIDLNIITCTGGSHPTTAYKEVLQDENIDFIVLGEGEYSFLELITEINTNQDLSHVDGIAYMDSDTIKLNPKTKYIENLDKLPLPARHLLKMEKYIYTSSPHSGIKRQPFTSMITSRGCPFRCGFCVIRHLWGLKPRYRSAENVLMEIKHLINEYGIKEIHFEDDNLTAQKRRAIGIFAGIIENGWDLTLNSPSGLAIQHLDEDLLKLMKQAGYYSITIAIESGDKNILKLMNKLVDLDKAKSIIKSSRKLGLKTKGFFILGYPGETKAQMKKTIDYAANSNLDWTIFFIATPIPGSELDTYCRDNNYLLNKDLDYIKQFYISNIKTPEFTPEYVEALKEKANLEINFKNNTNMRLGNYDRAIEDFSEIIRLYPHLDFPRMYLKKAMYAKSHKK